LRELSVYTVYSTLTETDSQCGKRDGCREVWWALTERRNLRWDTRYSFEIYMA
jgi:hypothetical protein